MNQLPAQALDAHLAESRHVMIDFLWLSFSWIAVYVALFNIWRAIDQGWQLFYAVNLGVSLMAIAIAVLRRRLPLLLKSVAAVAGFFALGLASMYALGMGGIGFFWLVEGALLTGALFSMRAGIRVMVLAVALLVAMAIGFLSGWITPMTDMNERGVSFAAWFNYVLIAPVFPVVMLYAIGRYQNTIRLLLADVHRQRDELEVMATHDQLTGLPVRLLVHDRLQQALASAGRSGQKVAVLIIDLDGFKAVNDGHGHEAGDTVLKSIAQRLRETLRAEDTAGRIGGDEFVAVLPRLSDAQDAAAVAEKLIAAISRAIDVSGHPLSVGASIGIAVFPDHGTDADSLSRAADQAMYTVKRTRKNGFAFAPGVASSVAG